MDGSRYGVAPLVRASQQHVVNVAQDGGLCAVMVSAKPLQGDTPQSLFGK
jgi:hypothetical protein